MNKLNMQAAHSQRAPNTVPASIGAPPQISPPPTPPPRLRKSGHETRTHRQTSPPPRIPQLSTTRPRFLCAYVTHSSSRTSILPKPTPYQRVAAHHRNAPRPSSTQTPEKSSPAPPPRCICRLWAYAFTHNLAGIQKANARRDFRLAPDISTHRHPFAATGAHPASKSLPRLADTPNFLTTNERRKFPYGTWLRETARQNHPNLALY